MKLKLSHFALVAMTSVLMTLTAVAAPIPGLFNTGVDNSSVATIISTPDIHYTLISGPALNAVSSAANPGWLSNNTSISPHSQWIGPSPTPNVLAPSGIYTYELIFNLTGLDESTAQISGSWASDNSSLVRLNGTPAAGIPHNVGVPFKNFDTFSFPVGSSFVPGLNSLTFEVNNFSGPSGLLVGRLAGTAAVPEPGTMTLFLAGLLGLLRCNRCEVST